MRNTLGIGAILHHLSGGSQKDPKDYYGRIINSVSLVDNEIKIGFTDGVTIKIYDDGQSCCEDRYIDTEDDIKDLVNNTLVSISTKEGPNKSNDYGVHETVFLEIQTDKLSVTFCTHNEHNGYYGGFGLSVDEI